MENKMRITIMGRLGKNPELKYTKNKEAVCNFSVAEKIEGEDKPRWHKVVVWGKQAESCNVLLRQGSPIFVQGQIISKEFINAEGEPKKSIELKGEHIGFINT